MDKMPYIKIPVRNTTKSFKHLGENLYALVDGDYDGEYLSQFRWFLTGGSYVARTQRDYVYPRTGGYKPVGGNKFVYLHRMVLQPPKGMWVTFKDGNRLNCRSCNLELITPTESAQRRELTHEQRARNSNSKLTPYRGVTQAYTSIKGELRLYDRYTARFNKKNFGSFDTPEQAARVYDALAYKKYGNLAVLNFPEEVHRP